MVPLPDLGVGNIVTLCQWVWKQYNNYQDAPNEFDQIASQANTCLTALKKVELELEKPHSLVQHAEPETKEHLDEFLRAMSVILNELKGMMLDYQGIHTSRRRRFAFGFNGLDRLPELRRKLADQEQHLQTWLAGLVIGGIGRLEVTTQKIFDLLKTRHDMPGNKESKSPQMIEDSIKTEVEQSIMSEERKQVVLELAKRYPRAGRAEQESLESQLRESIPQLPAGMKITVTFDSDGSTHSVSRDRKGEIDWTETSPNSARLPRDGPTENPESEKTLGDPNPRAKRLERREYRILCVDGANTVRSVIAHTYLQLVRILTVNNANRWMFQEADSAGCFVESEFTREHRREIGEHLVPPRVPAYKALAAMGKRQRFSSREKDGIMKRMQSRVTQGLEKSHFYDWDYILYFDQSIGKLLHALKTAALQSAPSGVISTAKLVYLTGTEWNSCLLMQDTIDAVQISLRTWLKKELEWVWPPIEARVQSGPWRTKELVIPDDAFQTMFGIDGSESDKVEAKTGCTVKFTGSHPLRPGRLVSIIGPQELLSSLPDEYRGVASFPMEFRK